MYILVILEGYFIKKGKDRVKKEYNSFLFYEVYFYLCIVNCSLIALMFYFLMSKLIFDFFSAHLQLFSRIYFTVVKHDFFFGT